ncbi:hypothetical protein CHS0354_035390 [Potamilus streckersoni]|uniref:Protein FAM228B n=1 Tax=Potamilus streckersoni TaxID=2493646 RepID=A0AAE0TET4_9BIVA|nr:hypothetical protein CHS0354_035390 [Potamilus streckersoni]
MASLLCVKQPGGTVQVHDAEIKDILVADSTKEPLQLPKRKSKRPQTSPLLRGNMDAQSLIGQTMKVQNWLNEKTIRSVQQARMELGTDEEKSDLETKAARKMYSPLLETEATFVKSVEDFLNTHDVLSLRKKEVLHKKWNERVYEPMRKKVVEVMNDGQEWQELDRRKRELHKQYLEFVNEKNHVFLDTMDPREYYALALNGHRPAPIKVCFSYYISGDNENEPQVETRLLRDPLLSQGRDRNEEERTILRCMTGHHYTDKDIEQIKLPPLPLVPLGRHGADSISWLEMPLGNIESTPRKMSRRRMHGIFNDNQLNFEEWSKIQYNHEATDKELKIQKKRSFKEKPPFQPEKPRKKFQKRVFFCDPDEKCPIGEMMAVPCFDQGPHKVSIGVGTSE